MSCGREAVSLPAGTCSIASEHPTSSRARAKNTTETAKLSPCLLSGMLLRLEDHLLPLLLWPHNFGVHSCRRCSEAV